MAIITLTTDLGLNDYYVGAIKGAIYSQLPDIKIVDITHNIPQFDISQAAFVLKNVIDDFPSGTIHIIGVLPDATIDTSHLIVMHNEQYFIGADNGIFSLIFETKPEKIYELNVSSESVLNTFPTKDVFVKAACHIARGGTPEVIGKPKNTILEKTLFEAVAENNAIRGSVIYIDSYGNVITNIKKQLFNSVGKGRNFKIMFRTPGYTISKISKNYNDVIASERLALFGHTGFLEIAINIGHASNLLGLKLNDIIRIEFFD